MTLEDKSDLSATGAFKKYAPGLAWLLPFRSFLTPSALWAAIGMLTIAIASVVNAQLDIRRHQESITGLQQERAQDRELLQKIDMQLAVMNSRLGDIALEVDRQREWRENIEQAAEAPPHARHR